MNDKTTMNLTPAKATEPEDAEYTLIYLLNRAPVRIKTADWPVFYEMAIPVARLGKTGDLTTLVDLIISDRRESLNYESPVFGEIVGAVSAIANLHLVLRKNRGGKVLLVGKPDGNNAGIGELLDASSATLDDEVRRFLKGLIDLNGGHYVDEYENIVPQLRAAAKLAAPAINQTYFLTLDGNSILFKEADWNGIAEQCQSIDVTIFDFNDAVLATGNEDFGKKSFVVALKCLRLFKHKCDGRYLAIGKYLFDHPEKMGFRYSTNNDFEVLAPIHVAVATNSEEMSKGLLEIANRLPLSRKVVQDCLNALPAEDLL